MNGHDSSTSDVCLASWTRHAGGVALWLTVVSILLAPFIWFLQGNSGLVAAGIAAIFCGASAIGAQWMAALLMGPANPVHATMLAMMLRLAPPLMLCMAIGMRRGPLTEAGIVFYMIGFYLLTLAVDTWLSVRRISPAVSSKRG